MMGRLIIMVVRLYQLTLSPFLGNCCRFHPSCSRYCIEAVEKYGCAKGLWLAVVRLCKCHPFHPGGVDLVPASGKAGCVRHE